ncbi:transmembrane protein 18, partial [Musa troglodytarum]
MALGRNKSVSQICYLVHWGAASAMEDLKAALNEHVDLASELFEKFSAELRSGFGPAVDNFVSFFHAIDWKEPWLVCLLALYFVLLLLTISSRKNVNFQLCLSLLALSISRVCRTISGVYLADRVNGFLGRNWKSFSSQYYFDPHGLFIPVLWSGPLLIITIIIVVNTLFTLCHLMVKWKKAQLRHNARLSPPQISSNIFTAISNAYNTFVLQLDESFRIHLQPSTADKK